MLTSAEKTILEDYKKAFKGYYGKSKVVDLDESLGKKLNHILVRLEDTLPELGFNVPPYRASNFCIIYVTKGKGERIIGKIKVPVTAKTLIVVPGRIVNSGKYSNDTTGYYLSFNLTFFLQEHFPKHHLQKMYVFRAELIPYVHVKLKQEKALINAFEIILDEHYHERVHKNEMIALKILEVIIICERLFKHESSEIKRTLPPIAVQYLDLIQEHYREQHSASFYAKKLHVHPSFLNARCKQYLLQSAKATIDLKLITEAEYLLNHTTLSAKEIAYEIGFKSPSHFFRFFKHHRGEPPLHYRQKHLIL